MVEGGPGRLVQQDMWGGGGWGSVGVAAGAASFLCWANIGVMGIEADSGASESHQCISSAKLIAALYPQVFRDGGFLCWGPLVDVRRLCWLVLWYTALCAHSTDLGFAA